MTGAQGDDFEAQARQYWNAWGEALRQGSVAGGATPPEAASQDWSQALSWWRGVLGGQAPAAQETVDRFSGQAGDWLGLMQQVAARFAGRAEDQLLRLHALGGAAGLIAFRNAIA